MKTLALLFLSVFALTAISAPTPFKPAEWSYLKQLADGEVKSGKLSQKSLRFERDFSLNSAASGDTINFDEALPAGSIIEKFVLHMPTLVVSASDNSVAFTCESAGDLFTASDLTDATDDTVYILEEDEDASLSLTYSDGCTPTLNIGTGTTGITAGKIIAWIQYLVGE